MKILIAYGSKYGQTQKIADAIAETARREGADARAVPVTLVPDLDPHAYDAVILAAACYTGRFKKVRKFVRRNAQALSKMRNAFVAVSLSAKFEPAHAEQEVHDFVAENGWLPETFTCVAGAESFTKYGLLTGFVMRKIAREHGRGGDFSRDREYTDWNALAQFVREFIAKLKKNVSASAAAVPL